jgi:hypothetical protein
VHGPLARTVAETKAQLLGAPDGLRQQLEAAVDDFYERMQGIPELLGLDLGPKSGQQQQQQRAGCVRAALQARRAGARPAAACWGLQLTRACVRACRPCVPQVAPQGSRRSS